MGENKGRREGGGGRVIELGRTQCRVPHTLPLYAVSDVVRSTRHLRKETHTHNTWQQATHTEYPADPIAF